jgi:hypothetical protein
VETRQTHDCCKEGLGGSSDGSSPPAKLGKHNDDISIANDGGDGDDLSALGPVAAQ